MTFILEVIGTIVFAFAGALVAIDNDFDWFGINCMAVVTATGGGMTRDVILGNTPPMLFRNPIYVIIAVASAFITIMLYKPFSRSKHQKHIMNIVNILDAVGLAIFTVVGMNLAAELGFAHNGFLVCFVGVISAVGGGLLRDIMVNRTPVILKHEVYATASLAGSVLYFFTWGFMPNAVGASIAMALIFIIRIWSIFKKVNLPYVKKDD